MQAKVGDRLVVESERVGQREREGEILDIRELPLGIEYRIRWDDGRVTEIRPKAGSARVLAAPGQPPA